VTVDGIARKVKRARTSLYRRWPSKRHLVAYSVLAKWARTRPRTPGRCATTSRRGRDVTARIRRTAGAALAGLVADMAQDTELADIMRQQVLAARRESMREHSRERRRAARYAMICRWR